MVMNAGGNTEGFSVDFRVDHGVGSRHDQDSAWRVMRIRKALVSQS